MTILIGIKTIQDIALNWDQIARQDDYLWIRSGRGLLRTLRLQPEFQWMLYYGSKL